MAPLGGPAAAVAASMPISPSCVQTAMQSAQSVPASSPLEARCNLRGKTMAEYIFIGGTGGDLRSKTRVLDSIPAGPEDCPVLTFDGTLTGQVSSQMCQDASCIWIQLLPGDLSARRMAFRGGFPLAVSSCRDFAASLVPR